MNAPAEVADILLQILRKGLLQIRSRGWNGDAAAVAELADHLHDVPLMLSDYREGMLEYYWYAMKPCLEQTSLAGMFEAEWKRLQPYAESAHSFEDLREMNAS